MGSGASKTPDGVAATGGAAYIVDGSAMVSQKAALMAEARLARDLGVAAVVPAGGTGGTGGTGGVGGAVGAGGAALLHEQAHLGSGQASQGRLNRPHRRKRGRPAGSAPFSWPATAP